MVEIEWTGAKDFLDHVYDYYGFKIRLLIPPWVLDEIKSASKESQSRFNRFNGLEFIPDRMMEYHKVFIFDNHGPLEPITLLNIPEYVNGQQSRS